MNELPLFSPIALRRDPVQMACSIMNGGLRVKDAILSICGIDEPSLFSALGTFLSSFLVKKVHQRKWLSLIQLEGERYIKGEDLPSRWTRVSKSQYESGYFRIKFTTTRFYAFFRNEEWGNISSFYGDFHAFINISTLEKMKLRNFFAEILLGCCDFGSDEERVAHMRYLVTENLTVALETFEHRVLARHKDCPSILYLEQILESQKNIKMTASNGERS